MKINMLRRFSIQRLSMLALLAVAGCAGSSQTLDVKRDMSDESFVASFDRAYFSRSVDGQTDLILLSGGIGSDATAIDRPLASSAGRSVQQIVHIHVLWQDPRTTRADNPAATNAKISWHVMASPEERLVYSGACWARVDIDDDIAEVVLRNAGFSISQIVGNMQDPLKRATMDGTIECQRSDTVVRSYLDQLATLGGTQSNALSGTPSRATTTP